MKSAFVHSLTKESKTKEKTTTETSFDRMNRDTYIRLRIIYWGNINNLFLGT